MAMQFKLKDKERQAAFEKALPGFDEELQRLCQNYQRGEDVVPATAAVHLARFKKRTPWAAGEWSLTLPASDIEVIGKYDPHTWNRFPLVKPPRGILMRAEGRYRYGGKFVGAAVWDVGRWLPMEPMVGPEDVAIERFRPWEEEKE